MNTSDYAGLSKESSPIGLRTYADTTATGIGTTTESRIIASAAAIFSHALFSGDFDPNF